MRRVLAVSFCVCFISSIALADIFGTGVNQFTIDFVNISGNTNPASGYGIVNNDYRMGTFEITNDQWEKFQAAYGTVTGSPSSAYDGSPQWTGTNVPTNMVSWYEAAQFVNYLNISTGHAAAYKFTGTQGSSDYALDIWSISEAAGGTNLFRHKDAFYFLPTEDEWVKAAYWNGTSIQTYATQPGDTLYQGNGASGGWNYRDGDYATDPCSPWNVGSGSEELNGTFDMMGNVWELMESPYYSGGYGSGSLYGIRSGSYSENEWNFMSSTRFDNVYADGEYAIVGFRVASISAPGSSAPIVSNVTASQRTDGSKLVDIYFGLDDPNWDDCMVFIEVSDDGGSSWDVNAVSLTGDIGPGITPGTGKHIIWDCGIDLPGEYGTNYKVKVIADDGIVDDPSGMVWVSINDPGFNGQMSKYETTNAQYCDFLNAALDSNDITVSDNIVYGANGSNGGADYVGQVYFNTYAADAESQITYSGGTFSVRSRDGYSMSNHPVVMVSWYGATAFCNYYGYRLPTKWEWQAVADHEGEFIYGCGETIDYTKANYDKVNPLNLSSYPYTSPVNYYSSYGYGMNDMAGNVWEWTSSVISESFRVIRGGSWCCGDWWSCGDYLYTVSLSYGGHPNESYNRIGFRMCR